MSKVRLNFNRLYVGLILLGILIVIIYFKYSLGIEIKYQRLSIIIESIALGLLIAILFTIFYMKTINFTGSKIILRNILGKKQEILYKDIHSIEKTFDENNKLEIFNRNKFIYINTKKGDIIKIFYLLYKKEDNILRQFEQHTKKKIILGPLRRKSKIKISEEYQ